MERNRESRREVRDKESPRETKGASRRECMREGKQSEIRKKKKEWAKRTQERRERKRDAACLLLA